jgi:hypothetical protein
LRALAISDGYFEDIDAASYEENKSTCCKLLHVLVLCWFEDLMS